MRTFFLFCISICACFSAVGVTPEINIIPKPTQVIQQEGTYTLHNDLTIGYSKSALAPAANYLKDKLQKVTAYQIQTKKSRNAEVQLILDKSIAEDGYVLKVDTKGIQIKGSSYKGIVYGIATLRQLLPAEIEKGFQQVGVDWTIPAVEITDKPHYEWRGLMLDPVRHFYSVEETKALLDVMALYKFSKFHWHLIDSQAWRIEIKSFPLLTEKGAWREPTINIDVKSEELAKEWNDPTMHLPEKYFKTNAEGKRVYGGYYTQEEIKDVVKYAAIRGIDVVPELDMPGHNRCATQCYSWLSCSNDGKDPLCLGNDSVIKWAKKVYKEVFKLFPYGYAEIGGDEVNRSRWEKCPKCQARIEKEGLKGLEELQSWFTRDMEKFFNKHGKRLIGWDEILEGGISKTATVNWWQGYHKDVVEKATQGGNEVILCPTTHCYFDYSQDSMTLYKLYNDDFLPSKISDGQMKLIKGMQANIWGEYIPSEARMQFMVFPRALALAEKAWTSTEQMNWTDFQARLIPHLKRLQILKVNYRPLESETTKGFNALWK